jgi:hypothetical protein
LALVGAVICGVQAKLQIHSSRKYTLTLVNLSVTAFLLCQPSTASTGGDLFVLTWLDSDYNIYWNHQEEMVANEKHKATTAARTDEYASETLTIVSFNWLWLSVVVIRCGYKE